MGEVRRESRGPYGGAYTEIRFSEEVDDDHKKSA